MFLGARRIGVVTLGPSGCKLLYAGHRAELPGYPVKTVDLTGAGDVFAAAFFITASNRTVSPVTAARYANLVAALPPEGKQTVLKFFVGMVEPTDRGLLDRLKLTDDL